MKSNKLFDKSLEIIDNSPIKDLRKNNVDVPFEINYGELDRIKKDVETLKENLFNPLKIIILGEVKSGKSTIVNALIGEEISPVDVDEATSSIIEFHYSDEPNAKIVLNNNIIKGTPEKIYRTLKSYRDDKEFFSDVQKVVIGIDQWNLKQTQIVDTPGLATMNKDNENRTNNYIQNGDVVLWVFNANYLGQSDVSEKLKKIAKIGKPVVGIINKIDNVDDKERAVKYIEEEFGIYLKEIFPLSGEEAFEAVKNGNDVEMVKSGFIKIKKYLEKLNKRSSSVHEKSILSSFVVLNKENLEIHKSYLRNLEFIQKQIENFESKVDYNNTRIINKIDNLVSEWLDEEFLKNEEKEILELIDSTKFFNKSNLSIVKRKIESILDKKNIQKVINDEIVLLQDVLKEEWTDEFEELKKDINKEAEKFKNKEKIYYKSMINELQSSGELIKDGIGKGAIIGGTVGLVQGAILAATAAFTMSVFFIAIPFWLALGALTGGVSKLFQVNKTKKELKREVLNQINKVKVDIVGNNVVPKILEKFTERSNAIKEDIIDKFNKNLFKSSSIENVNTTIKETSKYINKQELFLNELSER